jgi:hypothetical protein
MTREEALNVLWWASKQHYPGDQMDITEYDIEAFDMAITALRGPQPDPITGLVPCGCGGKAKIWPSNLRQATHVIIDYEVGCTECAMTTGWVRGKQENAVKVWNTAMGWKGGAE